jgi:hypothetical protein
MINQKGMTFIGMLLVGLTVVMGAWTAFKIFPAYIQYYEVQSSIKALSTLTSDDFSDDPYDNATKIKGRLLNQLYINGLDIKKFDRFKVSPNNKGGYHIVGKYRKKVHYMYNMYFLFVFKINEEVAIHER